MRSNTFLNLLSSSLFNRTLYHLQPPAVVDARSSIMYFRLLLIVYEQKLLKYVFLAYADTDLSLLDIASSSGGSHFSSNELCKVYSEHSLLLPLPRNSNLLTWRYERRYLTFQMQTKLRVFLPPQNPDTPCASSSYEKRVHSNFCSGNDLENSTVFQ